jgi:nucleotide-binding universal stress UspA family protein
MSVLLAVDGPDGLKTLLPHARRLAEATRTSLRAIRVLRPLLDLADDRSPSVHEASLHVAARWKAELAAILGGPQVEGSVEIPVIERGESVERAILNSAIAGDIVAVRANNTGKLGEFLFGSTTASLLSKATVPVMVLGPAASTTVRDGPYRIMVTTDGSTASSAAFAALPIMFDKDPIELTIVRMLEPGAELTPGACEEELNRLGADLPKSFTVSTEVLADSGRKQVGSGLAVRASALGADAIVMATHGRSGLRRIVAGSVAMDVVAGAQMPVILVRTTDS